MEDIMSYLEKLKKLIGKKPKFNLSKVDGIHRAEVTVNGKRFIGFQEEASDAIETAARIAVDYIDPNNWVDDSIDIFY